MKPNIDNSRQLINKALNLTMVISIILPLIFIGYFKVGEENFVYNKKYYKVYTGEKPSIVKLEAIRKPLTTVSSVERWLRIAILDVYAVNTLNYNSKERWEKIKKYFSPYIRKKIWDQEITRLESFFGQGYDLTDVVIKSEPKLLGMSVTADGDKIWKFFLLVGTKSTSENISGSRYGNLNMKVIVKEMNSYDEYSGIGIVSIEIN